MSFILEKTRFCGYVERTAVASPDLKPKKDDSKDWTEKIFARKEKIYKFEDNTWKVIAKIGKMCIDTVQKVFFLIKTSKR